MLNANPDKKQITYGLDDPQYYQETRGEDSAPASSASSNPVPGPPPAPAPASVDPPVFPPPDNKTLSPSSLASLSTTGANASFSSVSTHSATSSSTSVSKTSKDLSISPDRSSNDNDVTREEVRMVWAEKTVIYSNANIRY